MPAFIPNLVKSRCASHVACGADFTLSSEDPVFVLGARDEGIVDIRFEYTNPNNNKHIKLESMEFIYGSA